MHIAEDEVKLYCTYDLWDFCWKLSLIVLYRGFMNFCRNWSWYIGLMNFCRKLGFFLLCGNVVWYLYWTGGFADFSSFNSQFTAPAHPNPPFQTSASKYTLWPHHKCQNSTVYTYFLTYPTAVLKGQMLNDYIKSQTSACKYIIMYKGAIQQ